MRPGRLLQPEDGVAVVVVQDPARHAEHPDVRRDDVDLPREAVSRPVGQVVMPHLRMLADVDQGCSSRPDPVRLPTSYCTRKVAQEDPTASADTRNTSSPLDLKIRAS